MDWYPLIHSQQTHVMWESEGQSMAPGSHIPWVPSTFSWRMPLGEVESMGSPLAATCSTSRARRRQPELESRRLDLMPMLVIRRLTRLGVLLTDAIRSNCSETETCFWSHQKAYWLYIHPRSTGKKWHIKTYMFIISSGRAPDWWVILTSIIGSSACGIVNYATCSISVRGAAWRIVLELANSGTISVYPK